MPASASDMYCPALTPAASCTELLCLPADETEDFSRKFEILLQLGGLGSLPSLSSQLLPHSKQATRLTFIVNVGRGSYGAVYKARVKASGEFVAIKVIQLGEGDKIADIQKEISMLSECNHPNVVRYLVRPQPAPVCLLVSLSCTSLMHYMTDMRPHVHD